MLLLSTFKLFFFIPHPDSDTNIITVLASGWLGVKLRPNYLLSYFLNSLQTKGSKRPARQQSGKGKKKKTTLRFQIDCTHPVEDGIMDVANFVSKLVIQSVCMQQNSEKLIFLQFT